MDSDEGAPAPRPAPRRRPPRGGQASRRDYLGCGLWAVGLLVLVVASFTVGILLRPDSGPETVTLTSGGSGAGAYRIEGYRDEADDEPCLRLEVDGAEVTGQCGTAVDTTGAVEDGERYVITSAELPDGTTIAFAPVPRATAQVRLDLDDGSRPVVDVSTSETTGITWFSHTSDAGVAGPAEMLDAAGDPIPPPR